MGTPINAYAAGSRRYRGGVSGAPNIGAVSNKTGYTERELRRKAQQRALQARMLSFKRERN